MYSLWTWIEGEDAENIIPSLSVDEQYHLGVISGQYLRYVHLIPTGNDQAPWTDYYNRKIDKYISNYHACGIVLKGADPIISFIEAIRSLNEESFILFANGHQRALICFQTPILASFWNEYGCLSPIDVQKAYFLINSYHERNRHRNLFIS